MKFFKCLVKLTFSISSMTQMKTQRNRTYDEINWKQAQKKFLLKTKSKLIETLGNDFNRFQFQPADYNVCLQFELRSSYGRVYSDEPFDRLLFVNYWFSVYCSRVSIPFNRIESIQCRKLDEKCWFTCLLKHQKLNTKLVCYLSNLSITFGKTHHYLFIPMFFTDFWLLAQSISMFRIWKRMCNKCCKKRFTLGLLPG